ncbi:MAG: acyl-CoA/acyl-ACP dehydrogenase [Burkholderiales bacterium]|nr:acyl-CoA/acyl-ACP dehydrogenase [Burkholderiales bacterium]
MDLNLTKEQRAWQTKAREFAREELRPITLKRDAIADPSETFDWDIIRKGSRLGFRTAATPKAYGGHGIDLVTQALVMTELAVGDSAISKTFSQNWKWSQLIAAVCTAEQKERFLRPFVADDTYLLGSGSTEPNSGSDNRMPPEDDQKAGVRLRAERRGAEWILNGEKVFIANGSVAKLFFVRARTDSTVHVRKGTTLFLVPRETPGFRHGKVFNKRGWRFYQNAELVFENARVPHENVVGEVNQGAGARGGDRSQFGDLELAANALGVCDAAVEMAMRRAAARGEDGARLFDHQGAQLQLSEMRMHTEALRAFVMRTAWERDRAVERDPQAAHFVPALFVTNFSRYAIQRVTALNMELHGATGALMHAGAEKLVRDAMIWTHLAGDSVVRMKAIQREMR